MNLIKNVDADWNTAKGRVRQDLDTIQRNYNALQAQLDALSKVVNTPAAVPAATIAANNRVTVPTGDFLSTVAVGAGLTGDGRVTNPLIATASGLTLATSSALMGAGTVVSPLAVNPDGVTITINGSNQLVAGTSLSGLHLDIVNISTSAWRAANATPITVVSGISNQIILPIQVSIAIRKPATSINNLSPTFSFLYTGGLSPGYMGNLAANMGATWTLYYQSAAGISAITNFTNAYDGLGLIVQSNFDMGAGTPPDNTITSIRMAILYTTLAL